jgi:hypothetical protein
MVMTLEKGATAEGGVVVGFERAVEAGVLLAVFEGFCFLNSILSADCGDPLCRSAMHFRIFKSLWSESSWH